MLILEKERSLVNNLTLHLKELENQNEHKEGNIDYMRDKWNREWINN